jgi:predicted dehydrogenase
VVQVGSQGCTDPKWHRANELIKQGKLGKVVWSQGSYCRNGQDGEWNYHIDEDATESNIDWAAFLGSAPKRPFDRERFFRWRKYWDYSAGITSDLFPHRLHPLMLAIGPEFPTRVACTGGIYVSKDREVPDTTQVIADFPSGHTILLAGCTVNEQGLEDMVRGHKATMYLGGNAIEIRPERPFSDEVEGSKEQIGIGEDIGAHERDFLAAIRTGKKPNCDIDLATMTQVTISMAEMSYRQNKMMRFDPEKMQLIKS